MGNLVNPATIGDATKKNSLRSTAYKGIALENITIKAIGSEVCH